MHALLSFVHLRKTMRLKRGQSSEHTHPASKEGEGGCLVFTKDGREENATMLKMECLSIHGHLFLLYISALQTERITESPKVVSIQSFQLKTLAS